MYLSLTTFKYVSNSVEFMIHNKKEKVLIIKTGYTEILDGEDISRIAVSFGDILRITPLLNLYKNNDVIWVSDERAFPLLENNPYIKKLLPFDLITVLRLESEEFDTVINLEKIPGICALSDKIKAWKRYGFRFNNRTGEAEAYDKAFEVLAVAADPLSKKKNSKTSQELLFEMVGEKWRGEEYILGYKPKTKEIYDVGLNIKIGPKWPTKAWSIKNWDNLENLLKKNRLSVTRQDKQDDKILTDLYSYIDWINSSKVIVSIDSLGLHLATALKKYALGLFGPTPHKEFCFYGKGEAILPEKNFDCVPCFKSVCKNDEFCLDNINYENVYKKIADYLEK